MADAENRSKILEAEQNGEWESYISLHPRAQRIHALAKCEYLFDDDARFWSLFGETWVTTDWHWISRKELEALLGCGRDGEENFMTPQERAEFAQLPDVLTVHRAYVPGRNEDGFSWTLDRGYAERLVEKGSGSYTHIKEKAVSKSEAFAYISRRGESEVILTERG